MRTTTLTPTLGAIALCSALISTAGADSLSPPYMLAVPGAGVQHIVPILTVGEGLGNYRLVGIPDGMGAYSNDYSIALGAAGGTFRLFINHELGQTQGVARAHGGTGAFVSQWDFNFAPVGTNLTFTPTAAQDAITNVSDYNDVTGLYQPVANGRFARLCSAYLAGRWNGFPKYAFMTGEETTDANTLDGVQGGQSFAVIDGTAIAVPRMGRYSKENQVVLRGTGRKTVVVGLDDSFATAAELYIYVGTKEKVGSTPLAPYGLHNGKLYTLVTPAPFDHENDLVKGAPVPFTLAEVDWTQPAGLLKAQAQSLGAMDFVRVEDGAYDLNDSDVFYFCTTGGTAANPNGKAHRLVFNDVTNPTLGGTIEVILDGSEGMASPDNLDINADGQLLLQEDPNFSPAVDSSIWAYDVNTLSFTRITTMNSALAATLDSAYVFGKWESSGIVDASHILGEGWWLFNVQAHYNISPSVDPELVQGGQLLAMKYIPTAPASDR